MWALSGGETAQREAGLVNDWGRLEGLIPIIGGVYGYLLAVGVLPRNAKNDVRMELWRKKFGRLMKILGPILVVFGLLTLAGVFG